MKRPVLKFTILLASLFFLSILVLFGNNNNYTTRYFETFRYVNKGNNSNQIYFINELTEKQINHKWYIQVYYGSEGEWVKFEKYMASNDKNKPNGSRIQTIENTLSIKSITQNPNPLNISSTDDENKS
ncbi:MAG TPA: hypothetical protein ENI73_04650 [Spirochaetes bacterium]|nr:hypothetical protein [Spirochaetota bacterium]